MRFILFLHGLGAVAVGIYLLLPVVTSRLAKLAPAAQSGVAGGLNRLNRFGQWLLVVQFLTGGYLISKFDYLTVLWMVVIILLFLVLGAVTGILGGPLKRISGAGRDGEPSEKDVSRAHTLSVVGAVLMLLLVVLMYYPELLGTRV